MLVDTRQNANRIAANPAVLQRKLAGYVVSSPSAEEELDEISQFSSKDAEFLASRGLVYITSLCLDEKSGKTGTIIAGCLTQAQMIAASRGHDERIVGLMGRSFLRNLKIRLLGRL